VGAAGGAAATSAVKLHIPEPPTGPSPAAARRLHGVQARAGAHAVAQAALPAGASQVADARGAVTEPDAEAKARAQAALIAQVQAAPSPEIVALCERIREVIRSKRPPDEDALMKAEPDAEAMSAGNQLDSTVEGESRKVQDSYAKLDAPPPAAKPEQGAPLPPQPPAADAPPVNAQAAAPDPVPAGAVSLDADAAASKQRMQDAGMDTPAAQLVKTGPVADARGAQGELDQAARDDPAQVLARQKDALGKAEGDMAALQAQALAALTTSRAGTAKGAAARQGAMVGTEASMREQASAEAKKTFEDAQAQVDALLRPLATDAMAEWEAAKDLLVSQFKADLAPVQARVDERHAGVGGWVVGVWDAVTGLPDWAEEGYTRAETRFGDGVIAKLTEISTKVNAVIAACDVIVKTAREAIAGIFARLPASLRDWAAGEQQKFDGQLDQLHAHVIAARDAFNKDLVERSSQAVDEVRTEIAELRRKAAGLVGRIVAAVQRFLDDPVKFIIEGLLDLLGIPPASFWAVVAKIRKVVKDIADDPLRFARNLLDGLGQGFSLFFDHILGHLLKGFLSWLTGGLAEAGVQLPKDLSLRSIVTFLLQLMGITWPRIRKILAKHVGEKNVALLEKVYSLVSFLIEKGPEGIFELIKEKLDPQALVDQVVKMAVDYMVSAVVKAATARILMLFNPVGAILQALEAIYRVLKWIFQNAARIFTLVETVVNGIADIIAGNLGGFAAAVEKGLAMLIAPVISFIADYLGFGDLPDTIAEKVKSFQEWILGLIDGAIGWLVEKGKALLAALGIGGKDKEGKKAGGTDVGKRVSWTAGEESHELWIEVVGTGATPMMASDGPGTVAKHLDDYEKMANALKSDPVRRARALDELTKARALLAPVDKASDEAAALTHAPEPQADQVKSKEGEVETAEDQLWPHLQAIQVALGIIAIPETLVKPTSGAKASSVVAEPLSKKPGNTAGTDPTEDPPGWEHVRKIDRVLLNPETDQYGPRYWRRMHLLSEKLHGPGEAWNLVPAVEKFNSAMKTGPEADAKKRIAEDEVLYYDVRVDFHSGAILEDFPSRVEVEYGSMRHGEQAWERAARIGGLPLTIPPPPTKSGKQSLNTFGRDALIDMGLPRGLAESVANEQPYQSQGDFRAKMKARYGALSRPVDFNTEYWPTMQNFMKAHNLTFD
jgi:hypothetical protein